MLPESGEWQTRENEFKEESNQHTSREMANEGFVFHDCFRPLPSARKSRMNVCSSRACICEELPNNENGCPFLLIEPPLSAF